MESMPDVQLVRTQGLRREIRGLGNEHDWERKRRNGTPTGARNLLWTYLPMQSLSENSSVASWLSMLCAEPWLGIVALGYSQSLQTRPNVQRCPARKMVLIHVEEKVLLEQMK